MRIANLILVCLITVGLSLFEHKAERRTDLSAYSHGTMICLQGSDGPGQRLLLTQEKKCEGRASYPRLEIDIRDVPISVHKRINIGPENGAFRCMDAKESCEQLLSGEIVFEHFEGRSARSGKIGETDGYYELKFRTGVGRGHFKVDCIGVCG